MHIFVRLKRTWDQKLSSGWMMSGQLNSFFCGFDPRWFEEDLGSEVVFWFVAHVHVHLHLPIPFRMSCCQAARICSNGFLSA